MCSTASGEAGTGGERGGSKCWDMKARGCSARVVKESEDQREEVPRSSREERRAGTVDRPVARRRNWSSAKRRKAMKGLDSGSLSGWDGDVYGLTGMEVESSFGGWGVVEVESKGQTMVFGCDWDILQL